MKFQVEKINSQKNKLEDEKKSYLSGFGQCTTSKYALIHFNYLRFWYVENFKNLFFH